MISTKGRYAIRVMIDLAEQNSDKYVPLSEIAQRQEISVKYLEIIVKTFVKSNLLEGHRGKGGGYKLTRKPEEYTIGEIIELAEGTLAPVACLVSEDVACSRKKGCKTLPMWVKFNNLLHDFFYGITLRDLMDENFTEK